MRVNGAGSATAIGKSAAARGAQGSGATFSVDRTAVSHSGESAAVGAAGAFVMAWASGSLDFQRTKEAVFLTAKTTSMVCWLFVGSALFSAVFAILGGQRLVEEWVMAMNLSPIQFLLLSQAIIFILGWPLEWTEIIVIFVPIFLPLLTHFQIDPILWGVLVFVNLQAAFLSPPKWCGHDHQSNHRQWYQAPRPQVQWLHHL